MPFRIITMYSAEGEELSSSSILIPQPASKTAAVPCISQSIIPRPPISSLPPPSHRSGSVAATVSLPKDTTTANEAMTAGKTGPSTFTRAVGSITLRSRGSTDFLAAPLASDTLKHAVAVQGDKSAGWAPFVGTKLSPTKPSESSTTRESIPAKLQATGTTTKVTGKKAPFGEVKRYKWTDQPAVYKSGYDVADSPRISDSSSGDSMRTATAVKPVGRRQQDDRASRAAQTTRVGTASSSGEASASKTYNSTIALAVRTHTAATGVLGVVQPTITTARVATSTGDSDGGVHAPVISPDDVGDSSQENETQDGAGEEEDGFEFVTREEATDPEETFALVCWRREN